MPDQIKIDLSVFDTPKSKSEIDLSAFDVKKKEPTDSNSLSGQSQLPLDKKFEQGQGLADNSFLKQIGDNAAASYATPSGMITSETPLNLSLNTKEPKKDYYNAPQFKLEKGLIFDKNKNLVPSSSEALSAEIPRLKKEDINLKKSTQKDLVEQSREMPIEQPKIEEPEKEGEWGFDKAFKNTDNILTSLGRGDLFDANLVQNVAANFELAGTKFAKNASQWVRDMSSGLTKATGQGEFPELFDKEGKPTKYAESATWLNDPLGKVALGLQGNQKRMESVIKNNNLPKTFFGKAVTEIAGYAPDIVAAEALMPATIVAEGASALKTIGAQLINPFTKWMALKGGVEGYGDARSKGENVAEAAYASLKGTLSGAENGIEMALLGAGSNLATKGIMAKAEQMGLRGTAAHITKELINGATDVTAFAILGPQAHAALEGRWLTADEIAKGTGVAALFRAKGAIENIKSNAELNKAIQETQELKQGVAMSNFVDADHSAIRSVYYTKESADELHLQALDYVKKAKETSDLQKKAEYIAKIMTYERAANVKQVTEDILNNPESLKKLEESNLPDNVKQEFLQKAEEIRRMLDPIEQQKTALDQDIKNTQEFIKKATEKMNAEPDTIKKRELEVRIDLANKYIEETNNKLKDLIKEQIKPNPEEDLTTDKGIKKAQKQFNKKIDEQIKALDKNNPDYENDLEALNKKKEAHNEHYDTLLNTKASVTDVITNPIIEPAVIENKKERYNTNNEKFVKYNPNDVLPLLEDYKPTNKMAVEDYVIQTIPNDASVEAYKKIPIDAIKTSEKIDSKDRKKIDKIKEGIKNGDDIPPIVVDFAPVIKNGEPYQFGLMDGHHRYIAYKELGIKEIPAAIVTSREHYEYETNDSNISTLFKTNELKTEVKVEEPKVPEIIPAEVHTPIINRIKKGIQKLFNNSKIGVLKGNNFQKALDEAMKTGNVNLMTWGGFEKLGFEETEKFRDLVKSGHIVQDYKISELAGKPIFVINPDNMMVGKVLSGGKLIGEGEGGVHFVSNTGDVWAFSDTDRGIRNAEKMVEFVNNQLKENGTANIILSRGDLGKLLSSHAGAKGAMRVLEHLVDQKMIPLSDFRKALIEVGRMIDSDPKSKTYGKPKYNIDFVGTNDSKSIHNDIENKFFNKEDNTFSRRGTFVTDIINHLSENSEGAHKNIEKIREFLNTKEIPKSSEKKTGKISFSLEGLKQAIGSLFADEATLGAKNSDAYAIIQVNHPEFKVERIQGEHESYGAHVRQVVDNIPLNELLDKYKDLTKDDLSINDKNEVTGIKPKLLLLSQKNHIADIVNNTENKPTNEGKLGSNQIGLAEGIIKPESELPSITPNLMTDANGKVYGFEQNGKIVLNADLMNGNTPFHEAGHLWINWAKENRSDLHDAGMKKIEGSKYLQDVKNNKAYQDNAAKLPEADREAYFKAEALAKAIGDNGEKFVTEAQKADFKTWVKDLWKSIAIHFGIRDMSPEDISKMTLDEFSKKVVADIVNVETEKKAKLEIEIEEKAPVEFSVEEVYKQLPKSKNLRESAQKTLINSNFDKIVEQLIKNDKIQKKC